MPAMVSTASPILANDFRALWREIGTDAEAALRRVGESGWFILGAEVREFEKDLAAFWGMREAIGCGNGMDAIEISLRTAGLQPGQRVLTTPLSAFATTLAILRAGGVPVFGDVDATGALDLRLARKLFEAQPDLRWMVPVHLFGQCMDLTELAALRDSFGLKIIEDCAQSIGATWQNQPCGSIGLTAATSFYPTKNLGTMGDGGAILTNEPDLATSARQWLNYGQSEKYVHTLRGLNSRLDEIHAAILRDALLPRLASFTLARRQIASAYREGLHHPNLTLPPASTPESHVNHLFPLYLKGNRESFMDHLRKHHIVTGIHYPHLIPDQPAMQGQCFEIAGSLPVARRLASSEISLPIHPHLSAEDCARVIDVCNSWKP